MSLKNENLVEIYRTMLKIRHFEETVGDFYGKGLLPGAGNVHLYAGEEAVAVGVCSALKKDDYITSTHRGHGHCIAKGAQLDKMMAEIFGKETGYCKGKGGSMHIADSNLGILGANGIVGAGIPQAVGAGLSSKLRHTDQVCVSFFGDGASNTGAFHEALNLASVWKLPVIFVCENNLYGITVPANISTSVENVSDRAKSYNIPGVTVDGMDVEAVFEAASEAVDRARKGNGPTLLECKTYRYRGHFEGDPHHYRTKEEVAQWMERDPRGKFRKKLVDTKTLTDAEADKIEQGVIAEVDKAAKFALESPLPSPEIAMEGVFADSHEIAMEGVFADSQMREITFGEAIREALREEMLRDETVFIMGEDIRAGAWCTSGLVEEFGKERVRDTPISELGIVGCAIGAARTGLRPVVEIMFDDLLPVAAEQIVNQAPRMRYMFGETKTSLPVVIRSPGGSGPGIAGHHSSSLADWFMHIPGLKVVVPSTPYDAKGLLKTAIRGNDPVLFDEHKQLYATKGPVPEGDYTIPFGKADIKREGKDVTIVATSLMVLRALSAAEKLSKEGVDAEVIDPRTLVPLDKKSILDSVKKTGRFVVVHESWKTCGMGSELGVIVAEEALDSLDAPIKRVAAKMAPIPFSPPLERYVLPSEDDIVKAVREVVA